jgi:L-amino acid N-acyltransferase YncA
MLIRPARPSDARAMARVYVHTWQQTYRGLVPDPYLDAMTVGRAERAILRRLDHVSGICSVAEADSGQVTGFVTGGPARAPDDIYSGEIYELYLLKAYRGRGTGRQMVQVLSDRFSRMGIHSMMVWVLARNPYRHFYEKINGVYLRSTTIPFAGVRLKAVAYGWICTDLVTPAA